MDLETLLQTLESGGVLRFHACPKMRKQRLSDHQWKVALIAEHLLPSLSKNGIMHALTHDRSEIVTGDIPATLKWEFPRIKECLKDIETRYDSAYSIPALERVVIKLADIVEGMLFCKESYEDGCKEAKVIFHRWMKHLYEYLDDTGTKQVFIESGKSAEEMLTRLESLLDECLTGMVGE